MRGGYGHHLPLSSPDERSQDDLCCAHMIAPSATVPLSRGVPRWGQVFDDAYTCPSSSHATRMVCDATLTDFSWPGCRSAVGHSRTHASCFIVNLAGTDALAPDGIAAPAPTKPDRAAHSAPVRLGRASPTPHPPTKAIASRLTQKNPPTPPPFTPLATDLPPHPLRFPLPHPSRTTPPTKCCPDPSNPTHSTLPTAPILPP
mmetsp:Transcript_333/g.1121  ORF Transcript_333/g.1121 Transcript_333/m.1121 type:complete len:202 (-) Transcript_333:29-634(-)